MPAKEFSFRISGFRWIPVNIAVWALVTVMKPVQAQQISCRPLHSDAVTGKGVYRIQIRNTSADSIMVLHTREVSLPPLINHYRWEADGGKDGKPVLYFGKSDDTHLPEGYRATKTLLPADELELFVSVPGVFLNRRGEMVIHYSMLSSRFKDEFLKLEARPGAANMSRCKNLKEKYGVVFKKKVEF